MDSRLNLVPVGVPGELCIGGLGLARGYLNRPGLTAERFVPDPFGEGPGARLYRTGDLARWRPDGTLELVGRTDHQVKIRGFRVELGEIEAMLSRHPAVRLAAVVARGTTAGDTRLAAYVVADAGIPVDAPEVRRWLKERLPDYMVPASLMVLDSLPLSPNGKVDRRTLTAMVPAADAPDVVSAEPRTPVEALLARLAAEVLGVGQVGILDNFFELGIDSIHIIRIVSKARQAGLRLDPGQLFQHQTIAALAAAIDPDGASHSELNAEPDVPGALLSGPAWTALAGDGDAIEDAYPLSPVQQGMLFHTLAAPGSGVYIEEFTCRLRGELDVSAFEASWRSLLVRHPALRTSIQGGGSDQPAQVVHRSVDLPLDRQDWRGVPPSEQAERLTAYLKDDRRRGFVIARPPLLRLALLQLDDDVAQLVWSHHHIVMDGWCMPVLMMEFLEIYDAVRAGVEPALPPRRPFRDYIAWLQNQDPARAEEFWRPALAGVRVPTPLGIDRENLGGSGDDPAPHEERHMHLEADVTEELRSLARANQVTLNTVVQGAWALLLGRYSGQAEVVFGVASSGRPTELAGAETMIGLFINTLPMRVAVPDEAELAPWLRRLQARQAELRRYEATPLVQIQGWSEVPRGRPLFESLFIFENFPVDDTLADRAGRLGIEAARFLDQTNYPLNIMAVPGEQLFIKVGYDPRRFDDDAIERLLGHLRILLEGIAADPGRRLGDLPWLSETEREQLLRHWNEPGQDLPHQSGQNGHKTVPDLDRLPAGELDSWIEHLQRSLGETGDEPCSR